MLIASWIELALTEHVQGSGSISRFLRKGLTIMKKIKSFKLLQKYASSASSVSLRHCGGFVPASESTSPTAPSKPRDSNGGETVTRSARSGSQVMLVSLFLKTEPESRAGMWPEGEDAQDPCHLRLQLPADRDPRGSANGSCHSRGRDLHQVPSFQPRE